MQYKPTVLLTVPHIGAHFLKITVLKTTSFLHTVACKSVVKSINFNHAYTPWPKLVVRDNCLNMKSVPLNNNAETPVYHSLKLT